MHGRYLIMLILFSWCVPVLAQEKESPLEIEISAVEVSFPAGNGTPPLHVPTRSEIEQLPKKSITVLDRVSAIGKSGERFTMNHIINPAAPKVTDQNADSFMFARDESGTKVETEFVMATDAASCDANIAYRFRNRIDAHDGKNLIDVYFTTSFTARINTPVVLHVSAVRDRQGTFIVIIARVHFSDSGDWKVKTYGKLANGAVNSPKK